MLICQRHQTMLRLLSSAAMASIRWRVHELYCLTTYASLVVLSSKMYLVYFYGSSDQLWTCHSIVNNWSSCNMDCGLYLPYGIGGPVDSPHLIACTWWTVLATWLCWWVWLPWASAWHVLVICWMVSNFSQHFLQILLLLLYKYILYVKCLKFSLYLTEGVSVLQGLEGGNLRVVWNKYTCFMLKWPRIVISFI